MNIAYDGMDDELIKEYYNNPRWEDEMFLDPAEDKDDLEWLIKLRKEIGSEVDIDFVFLPDDSLNLLKESKIIK